MSPTYLHMLFTDLTDNKSCRLYTQHNAIKHFLTCRIKVHAVAQQSQTSSLFRRVKAITNYVSDANSWRVNHNRRVRL